MVRAAGLRVQRRYGVLKSIRLDGSKFKAVNNRDRNVTPQELSSV